VKERRQRLGEDWVQVNVKDTTHKARLTLA